MNSRFLQRVKRLEAKVGGGLITLRLKDGTTKQIPERLLFQTFHEAREAISAQNPPGSDENSFQPIPIETLEKMPVLRAILDTESDTSDGQMVELIQCLCYGPARSGEPVSDR